MVCGSTSSVRQVILKFSTMPVSISETVSSQFWLSSPRGRKRSRVDVLIESVLIIRLGSN